MIAIPKITITKQGIALRADFAGAFLLPAGLNLAMKLQCKLPEHQATLTEPIFMSISGT
jgi:hypothetical protein